MPSTTRFTRRLSGPRRFLPALLAGGVLAASAVAVPAAHPDDPNIRSAIGRAVGYLKGRAKNAQPGYGSLVAYALMKAKVPPTDPDVAAAMTKILRKIEGNNGVYTAPSHDIYEAGVDLMALEAADPEKYKPQIEQIVKFILKHQLANGSWDYPGGSNGGDTSITQYALLGLWAAARAGVKVADDVWSRAGKWYLNYQLKQGPINGAFSYHPAAQIAKADTTASHAMTAAGVGSMLVVRLQLYPGTRGVRAPQAKRRKNAKARKKFGVLETIKPKEDKNKKAKAAAPAPSGPNVAAGVLDGGIGKGIGWLGTNYTIVQIRGLQKWPMYYLYALERAAALGEFERLADHDWYAEGSAHLVKVQYKNGSWAGQGGGTGAGTGTPESTAFALLFLVKSTAKILKRSLGTPDDGATGLQAGGRGLSSDLSLVGVSDGKVKSKKTELPIDRLLAELENPANLSVEDAQVAIVETIQIGNREALIGQKERLKKLAEHPDGNVRRTAFWALGRCEDLQLVPLLLRGLSDNDVSVVVEARNALCTLSRKPRGILRNGVALVADPLAGLPTTASDEQRRKAIDTWQNKLKVRWWRWYFRIRPYTQRDALDELRPIQQLGRKPRFPRPPFRRPPARTDKAADVKRTGRKAAAPEADRKTNGKKTSG